MSAIDLFSLPLSHDLVVAYSIRLPSSLDAPFGTNVPLSQHSTAFQSSAFSWHEQAP